MIISNTTDTCGTHIAGFQCDICKKIEITSDFPCNWYRDCTEMLCYDCLVDAYCTFKSMNTEYKLSIAKIQKLLTDIINEGVSR